MADMDVDPPASSAAAKALDEKKRFEVKKVCPYQSARSATIESAHWTLPISIVEIVERGCSVGMGCVMQTA